LPEEPKEIKKEVEYYLRQAEYYLGEALKQKDLRQMAEKAHTSATMASDALILSKGMKRPVSLLERKRSLEKVSPGLRDQYMKFRDELHRDCFQDGFCRPDITKKHTNELESYIKSIKSLLGVQK
jgi:hypothetical protein